MKRTLAHLAVAALVACGGAVVLGSSADAAVAPAPKRLAAGSFHSVLLSPQGQLYGTGRNFYGQLTGGSTLASTSKRTKLTLMRGIPKGVAVRSVSAGTNHTIVLGSNGKVYGTGEAGYGELGGSMSLRRQFGVVPGLPAGVKATAAIAGEHHTLVIGSNGSVFGTGQNYAGELTGTDAKRTRLAKLTGLPAGISAVDAAAGGIHSVVLGSNGRVYATGSNSRGQLTGTGPSRSSLEVLPALPAGATAIDVEAGAYTTLVLGSNGVLYGAGAGDSGQLTGDVFARTTLTAFTGLPAGVTVRSMSGGAATTLVIGSDGRAYATGWNFWGATTGPTDAEKNSLTEMTGLPAAIRAVAVAAGYNHSLVLGSNGRMYATGDASFGQVGGSVERRTLTLVNRTLALEHIGKQPVLQGKKKQGATLRVKGIARADFRVKAGKLTYQWYRGKVKIGGATTISYQVKAADRGKKLKVRITGSTPGYRVATVTSKAAKISR